MCKSPLSDVLEYSVGGIEAGFAFYFQHFRTIQLGHYWYIVRKLSAQYNGNNPPDYKK